MIIKSIPMSLLLVFVGLTSHGQKTDSLKELLLKNDGLERVDVLCELSNNHLDSDPNAALAFAAEGFTLSATSRYSLRIVRAGRLVTRAARQAGLLDSAVSVYETILATCRSKRYTPEKLMRVETEYLERESLTKASLQQELIKVNQAIISRQAVINRLILVLALISLGFVILVYRNFQQKKRLNELLDKKLEERTRELKRSHEKLLKGFEEQGLLNSRTVAVFNEAANGIKRVCSVGLKEVSDPVARSCFERIDHMSQHMVEFLDLHFRNKETVTFG